jgi:hypothetical protein
MTRKPKLLRPWCACLIAATAVALALGVASVSWVGSGAARTLAKSGSARAAAGSPLFGNRDIGTHSMSDAPGVARAFRFHNSAKGTARSIVLYVGAHSTARSIRVGVYSSRRGHPGRRLIHGVRRSLRNGRWNAVAVTPAALRSGRTYWIAFVPRGGRLNVRLRAGGCRAERLEKRRAFLPSRWTNARRVTGCDVSAYVGGRHRAHRKPAPAPKQKPKPKSKPTPPNPTGSTAPTPTPAPGGGDNDTGCSPGAGATMTNTVSHTCGFADTTNTGVPAGTDLVDVPGDITAPAADGSTGSGWSYDPRGFIRVDCCNAVVKNIRTSVGMYVTGTGSTIEDSDLTGAAAIPIEVQNADNVTIANDDIHGASPATGSACAAGVDDTSTTGDDQNITIENNNIYWCATGVNGFSEGGLIANNYVHDFGFAESDNHLNGIQLEAGSGAAPMTISNNTLLTNGPQTDAIMLANDGGGTESNRTITHNLIAGGGYCFYGSGGPNQSASAVTFSDNHFSRIFYSGCGSFGPIAYWVSGNQDVWSGNVWDDTGASIQP